MAQQLVRTKNTPLIVVEYIVIVIFSLLNISYCSTSGQIDYESVSEILTLPAGNFSRVCVDIVIIDNPADENDEVFILILANGNNWPQFRNLSQVIIIDDGKLLYYCSNPSFSHSYRVWRGSQ